VPLDDRGLTLADGVFETVLVRQGQPRLLAEHLERWQRGAALLGLPPPPPLAAVQNLAASAVERSGIQAGALRLNWSRGSGGRGSGRC
jgi:branched-subunit amino acid aminotransferase/4-amino-4-deoxychorismate lyase